MVVDGLIKISLYQSKNYDDLLTLKKLTESNFCFYQFKYKSYFYIIIIGLKERFQYIDYTNGEVCEIVKRKRLIRSFNGLFEYILEMRSESTFEVLDSNLEPGFWTHITRFVKRRQKGELKQFLSNSIVSVSKVETKSNIELKKIQNRLEQLDNKMDKILLIIKNSGNLRSFFVYRQKS